jgi:hypothetical protein
MFLKKAKVDLNTCIMNLQKSRSEIFIAGDRTEKLQAARLRTKLEETIIIARNLDNSISRLLQSVPSREQVEQMNQKKEEEAKVSKDRWGFRWQLS